MSFGSWIVGAYRTSPQLNPAAPNLDDEFIASRIEECDFISGILAPNRDLDLRIIDLCRGLGVTELPVCVATAASARFAAFNQRQHKRGK
jgi:hypothetical protein